MYLKDKKAFLKIRISNDLLSRIREISVNREVPVSDLVRLVLSSWVMRNENKAADQHD